MLLITMENITVRRYKTEDYILWNNFILASKNATFLFHRDFMEYHQDRFEDFSIVIEKNGDFVGVFPANINRDVVYSHAGLSYGGLVVKNEMRLESFVVLFNKLFCFLETFHVNKVVWKEIPSFYTLQGNDEWKYLMHLSDAKLLKRYLYSVIQLKSEIRCSKSIKRDSNLGKRFGFTIEKSNDLSFFWKEVLEPTLLSVHGVQPVHSYDEISSLKNKFPNQIQFFSILLNNKIVGGTVLFVDKNVVHVQYISALREYRKFGALDYLFYKLINEEFSSYEFFDFGSSHEEGGNAINEGLLFWKESFGARSFTQDVYEIDVKSANSLKKFLI